MTDNKERIMEKIQALLQKTVENGASQEEAIAAATMAQKLMAKYKIEEIAAPEPEKIDSTEAEIFADWQMSLAHVIAKNTCCEAIRSKRRGQKTRFIIMGTKKDREVWEKLFSTFFVLIYQGIQEEKKKAKERWGHCRDVAAAYARGYISAIDQEMGQQCRALALVVPDEVKKATADRFPHLTYIRTKRISESAAAATARANGYSDGKTAAGRKMIA
jgi:hypothetical protein